MFARGFKTWCENIATHQRKDLNLAAHAPLDPRSLAKNLGVTVWTADSISGVDPSDLEILTKVDGKSWSAVTLCFGSNHLVLLNPAHSSGRMSSDLMHELSHIILGHKPARVDVTEDNCLLLQSFGKLQEEEANWLAGSLLLPREALLHIHRIRMPIETAKKTYHVSSEMFEYRMNVSGARIQIQRQQRFRGVYKVN